MKSSCIALATLASAFLAPQAVGVPSTSTGRPAPVSSVLTIHIRAWIDGRSQLILGDDTAQWQHFDYGAPGRLGCDVGEPVKATYIDGVEWWPEWPDRPNCTNIFCQGCYSSVVTGLPQSVPDVPQLATIVPIAVRGKCSVVALPIAASGYRVVVEFNDNGPSGADWYEIELVLDTDLGGAFCASMPNSTGKAATLGATGSLSVAANDTYLEARSCPPGLTGLFFYGAGELTMPFANGYLCINPLVPGLHRISPLCFASPSGVATAHLDFPALPPGGAITAGSTWYFQYWFRDTAAGGAGSNLSHGLRLSFLP